MAKNLESNGGKVALGSKIYMKKQVKDEPEMDEKVCQLKLNLCPFYSI
ncbi:hypothetical protein AB9P05_17680 [Roseivirga sp. BDSF3-8]